MHKTKEEKIEEKIKEEKIIIEVVREVKKRLLSNPNKPQDESYH